MPKCVFLETIQTLLPSPLCWTKSSELCLCCIGYISRHTELGLVLSQLAALGAMVAFVRVSVGESIYGSVHIFT